MKYLRKLSLSLMIIFSFLTSATVFAADKTDPEAAKQHVTQVAAKAVTLLSNEAKRPQQEIIQELRRLLEENMAAEMIGKIVLGKPWRKLDKEQKAEYITLFKDYLFTKYTSLIGSYNGQQIVVTNAIPAGKRDVMVFTDFGKIGEDVTQVGWRIRSIKGQLKLLDVKIADLSMVQTERDQFQNVFKNSDIDGLMSAIRDLTEKMKKNSHDKIQKQAENDKQAG